MKKLIIGLVVIAVIVLAWWMLSNKAAAPTETTNPSATTQNPADVTADLQGLNATDLNAEFKDIDASAQGL